MILVLSLLRHPCCHAPSVHCDSQGLQSIQIVSAQVQFKIILFSWIHFLTFLSLLATHASIVLFWEVYPLWMSCNLVFVRINVLDHTKLSFSHKSFLMRQNQQKKPFAFHNGQSEHPYTQFHFFCFANGPWEQQQSKGEAKESENTEPGRTEKQGIRLEKKPCNVQEPNPGMFQILTTWRYWHCSGVWNVSHLLLAQSLNCKNTVKLLLSCFSWISFALKVIGTSWKTYYFSILYTDFIKRKMNWGRIKQTFH